MPEPCPFCEIIAGRAPGALRAQWTDAIALVPLNPVVPGHTLIVPRAHVTDYVDAPDVAGLVMRRAAAFASDKGPSNVITSRGRVATQSVWHLHLHVIPRAENDRVALPWHSGKHTKGAPDDN